MDQVSIKRRMAIITKALLKMAWSMVLGNKHMAMEIIIKGNLLMDYHKELELILGKMEVPIVETLNKDWEVGMDYGKWGKMRMTKNIRDIIVWIKNLDMGNILGRMDGFIKEIFRMTIDKDMANFLILINAFFKANGAKEIKL